jgi:hypothetical protein
MKRKIIAYLLSFALIFTFIFAACGKRDDKEENKDKPCGDFTLTSPSDQAENVDIEALFEWSSSVNALKYTLTLAKNEQFSGDDVYVKQNIASPYLALEEITLENDTTYYWKVEAIGRGENNRKTASNAPFSFKTASNTDISIKVSHLSYLSGDNVEISYIAPESAVDLELTVSEDQYFIEEDKQVFTVEVNGGSHSFSKNGLSGNYYARISAKIGGEVYYSDTAEFYIGTVYKLHDFSQETGGGSGENDGIRLFTDTQMSYEIVEQTLKVSYTVGSYLDYVIIDLNDNLKSVISDAAYFYIRYRTEAFLGYFLCKMRGDNSLNNNWKDYYINNIHSDTEWKEALIKIDVSTVANFNRLSMGVSTNLDGVIYLDDIYFILP